MKTPLRRLTAIAMTTVALAASVTACAGSDTAATADTLTVGFVVDPSWAQIPVAVDTGLFTKHGVDVKVVNFQSGVEALQAASAGQVDITTAADVPTSAVLTRTPTLHVVGDGSRWEGSRIVARRSAGVNTIADLRGKSIGTPLGTSAAYFITNALTQNEIDAKLVQVAPSAMVTAATQRNVDAVSIFQPYQAQVIQALGDDAVELTGGTYSQHSLYLSTQSSIGAKGKAITAFFAALQDASTALTKKDDAATDAVAKATQLEPALLRTVLGEFDFTLQLKPDLAQKLDELGQWAKSQGSVDPATNLPDYTGFLDGQFLPRDPS
ncbi:ABC transporter substrate-binding protein [Mycobacterium yunnanensis]|uniref:ABC transporter substrate-binding protein n=1 Tax=Mycobacterium yunnanensis TaxID=368477 RepID=A0A9X2Z7A7_9MYCO|nr:ABC transporter substrate-binding protein [Mycobacterium yunnanensis]MCV7424004.1 ABC transporter substrate-binding protein [Mycobacterium yunnanensis]